METGRISLLSVLALGFAVPSALLSLPSGQTSERPTAPAPSDATYHQTDGMTLSRESAAAAGMIKTAAVIHPRKLSLTSLTRIQILPSSFAITGPHAGQRLLVEGTFADGHEEELTSKVTVTISNPSVAKVEEGEHHFPFRGRSGNDHGNNSRPACNGTVDHQGLFERNHLEFS